MKARFVLACSLVIGTLGLVPSLADGVCAAPEPQMGEWTSYGASAANSRNQLLEDTIDASNVANVTADWVFNAELAQVGGGTFSNTPVISGGCVYLGSTSGWVFALNADDGEVVWRAGRFEGAPTSSLAGAVITGSPVIVDGVVYVGVSKVNDPYVVAIDAADGTVLGEWDVLPVPDQEANYRTATVSAPVIYDGVLFQGIMADEGSSNPRGGWSILDVDPDNQIEDGTILMNGWTIDDDSFAHGYRGASIWCTPALDEETGFLYACGGNPASKQIEHRYSNALLKFDLNQFLADGVTPNPDFGQIVDSYKGDVDQYYPGLDRQPACDQVPTTLVWSPTCLQLDLDFGASPNLFTISVNGNPVKILGALQKSGVYHAVYADHMERAWTAVVGTPCFPCNASSSAFDDRALDTAPDGQVYVGSTLPGQVVALTKDRGRTRWAGPIVSGTYFQSVSTANGVVYSMDNYGNLNAFDAELGVPLFKRNLALDVNDVAVAASSQGIAIARNTIYAASDQFVVAYGL